MTSAQPYAVLLEQLVGARDRLRYVLNWSESNTRVSTVMKTFTLPDRQTTKDALEQLYKDIPEAAEAISSLLKRVGELRELLVKYAVHEEFDYPGDAPESCGLWCNICNQHVDDDNPAIGHAETCALNSDASTQTVGGE
jgi:hypothetical protein